MTPVNRLIVALDVPNFDATRLAHTLAREAGVRFFKLSPSNFVEPGAQHVVRTLQDAGADMMFDLKVYDTPDSVRRIVGAAFATGARFVTVHPACARAALSASMSSRQVVLVVAALTSENSDILLTREQVALVRGAVCPPQFAPMLREIVPDATLVCPGIRCEMGQNHDHAETWGPASALHAGADYLVVGRPITRAADPVAAARAYLEEMSNA